MKSKRQMIGSILSMLLLFSLSQLAVRTQSPPEEPLKEPNIVFVGRVLQVGAVSFAGVPASPRTLRVRVDAIIEKPKAVSLTQGQEVTVEVKDPSGFREGVQATFYTEAWIFGKGLAVRELRHEIATMRLQPRAVSRKREEHAKNKKQLDDAELRARIQAADVVVVGRVTEVRPHTMAAVGAPSKTIVTEHDPAWREAVVRVDSGIKGVQANQEVVVRFPASLDVAWRDIPKFKEGQQGTFILRKDQLSGTSRAMHAGGQVDAYMAVSAQDVLSVQDAQRVRALAQQ